jgi:hypothetical protein
MPDYLYAYRMGTVRPGHAGGLVRWKTWLKGLGDALINPGTMLGTSDWVGQDRPQGERPLMGFSVIRAGSMQAALKIGRECPFCAMGTIEVAEIRQA